MYKKIANNLQLTIKAQIEYLGEGKSDYKNLDFFYLCNIF
jgi:hypothetical protein